ncbi:MAG TPA: hypothetical protein VFM18_23365 [Methanosarcina sp.]|nr:hypothetical protein [Methanosarcina sp.]
MAITLDEMSALANALIEADEGVDLADKSLKAAKEKARVLREETIPSAMQELGLESLKLSTGQTLSVKQEVYASIPAGNKEEAYEWLNQHGFGGLIKVSVDAQFSRGEAEVAAVLFQELQTRGLNVSLGQDVHAQTLKAFLKERIAEGDDIPLELFGARPVWSAKVK